MRKRLVKAGNSLALVIDQSIAKLLGLQAGSEVDLSLEDRRLIVSLTGAVMSRREIWIRPTQEAVPRALHARDLSPDFTLEPIRESMKEGVYVLRHPPQADHGIADLPVKMGGLARPCFERPHEHRVVVKGNFEIWNFTTRLDTAAGHTVITLQVCA